MAQTRDAMGLIGAGSLGLQLTPTVHPTHHYVAMGAGVTAGVLMSPVVLPAGRFALGSSTGLVPMLGEGVGFAAARSWISLHPATAAGVAAGGAVGAANIYMNREAIIAFFEQRINPESGGDQGSSLPSIPGVAKPGSIGSPLTQATRAPSRGRRGSRTSGRRRRAPSRHPFICKHCGIEYENRRRRRCWTVTGNHYFVWGIDLG